MCDSIDSISRIYKTLQEKNVTWFCTFKKQATIGNDNVATWAGYMEDFIYFPGKNSLYKTKKFNFLNRRLLNSNGKAVQNSCKEFPPNSVKVAEKMQEIWKPWPGQCN